MLSLLSAVLLLAAGPVVAFWVEGKLSAKRKERAYKRLDDDPNVFEGSNISFLFRNGVSEAIMTDCFIKSWRVGLLQIEDAEGHILPLTGEEFEDFYPIYLNPSEKNQSLSEAYEPTKGVSPLYDQLTKKELVSLGESQLPRRIKESGD